MYSEIPTGMLPFGKLLGALFLLFTSLVLACGGGGGSRGEELADSEELQDASELVEDLAEDAMEEETGAPDEFSLYAPLFDPQRVLQIELTLPAASWDQLRSQNRSVFDILGDDCLEGPSSSPFTWFEASVRIDGEHLARVGVRKKGFLGSLSNTKPSLKLSFDEYIETQRFHGLSETTLNNAKQDPGLIQQCLGYELFAAAGVPAPLCNFAHVTVNGEDLGLYVHLQAMKKQFLRRYFADDEGDFFEGALSDFRPDWLNTFERQTNKDELSRASLYSATAALTVDDVELMAALEAHFELGAFYRFWAMESLIGHHDGYAGNANNFHVYADPDDAGRFRFVPWGIDNIFRAPDSAETPVSVLATGVLAWRLYRHPQGRQRYVETMRMLLDEVWDETALFGRIDEMEALLLPHLSPEAAVEVSARIEEIRIFVGSRRAAIEAELSAPLSWEAPLRDAPCAQLVGSVELTFETSWGTLNAEKPFETGTGSVVDLSLEGTSLTVAAVGGTIGEGTEEQQRGMAVLALPLYVEGAVELPILAVELGLEGLQPGVYAFDFLEATGYVLGLNLETGEGRLIGILATGQLEFERIETVPGEPVRGRIHTPIFRFGW